LTIFFPFVREATVTTQTFNFFIVIAMTLKLLPMEVLNVPLIRVKLLRSRMR
jgi:hypothetical protein